MLSLVRERKLRRRPSISLSELSEIHLMPLVKYWSFLLSGVFKLCRAVGKSVVMDCWVNISSPVC